jgi:hypothetical protein
MSKSGLELAGVMLDELLAAGGAPEPPGVKLVELLAAGGAPEPPVLLGVFVDMVSQERTTPLTNSRGGGIVSSFQTFEFRFLSIAKTESVTFITTGDNKFVMS